MQAEIGKKISILETASAQFNRAAEKMELDDEMRLLLKTPFRELRVEVPLRRDDGSLSVFHGYRVQFNGARGPFKGGIRYHPEVDIDEVRGLAALMAWKTALVNIPFGGGKGGMSVNVKEFSIFELERPHPQVHRADQRDPRPIPRHTGPGHAYQRPGHGMDHG